MGFFKELKNKVRSVSRTPNFTMISQPSPLPARNLMTGIDGAMSDPRAPDTVGRAKLDVGLLPVRQERPVAPRPIFPEFNIGGGGRGGFSNIRQLPQVRPEGRDQILPTRPIFPIRNRRLPQIIPERMPSRRPTPRFFGGGLGSIFARLPRQRVRRGTSPSFPRAPLPMPPRFPRTPMPIPERMPRGRFPFERPGFAEGEGVDMNMIIAEQGAREGMSPPEMAAQRIKEFLGETGRTVSNRDAELFGMGMLTLEDIMQRAEPVTNRNLMQQEQMFFPESESLDQILEDLEKKN